MSEEDVLYDFSILTHSQPPDNEFIKNMVSLFLANMPETNNCLVKACKDQNWEEVHFNAHKMKAGIDTFNVKPLKSIIRNVEKKTKQVNEADIEGINNDIQQINYYIQKCITAMKEEINSF